MVAQTRSARQTTPGTKRKLAAAMENTAKAEITQEKKAALLGERKEEFIKIAKLKADVALQPRAKIDQETIDDYVEKMQSGIKFPPVIIFYDGQNHFLADGYHRREAHEVLGKEEILSEIIPGTLDEAKWYSYAVNASHGLPRSTEDKRRAIRAALSHPNSAKMNDSELGRYLKVSSNTVKKYREELEKEITPETETEAPTTETKRLVTRKSPSGKTSTFEQTVNSSARSKAQKEKSRPQQEFYNKSEFWEQPGEWQMAIPNDLLSSNIGVTFSVEEKGYRFLFVDKKKALLNEEYTQVIGRDEQKETATPFLYAQAKIKEWVDEKGQQQKKYFEALDAGFHSGIRVLHEKYGHGSVVAVNKGLIEVNFDSGRLFVLAKTELAITTPIEFSVGEMVRAKSSIGWPNNDLVQIVAKLKSGAYLVKEIGGKINRKGEDTSKTAVIDWWNLTREDKKSANPNIDAKIEDAPSENLSVNATEKNIDTVDYYLMISCLTNLSDEDLLQVKSAIDREIKIRNIEVVEVVDDIKGFQQALVKYAASQGKSSPEGWAHTVIKNHKNGEVSPLWDDFLKGVPLGSSSQIKRDWEVEPGVPYLAFKEERIQYWIAKGEPIESATVKAGNDLRNPLLAKDLWEGFLRKSNRIANEALKAKEMGVAPYLPPAFSESESISKESVMAKLTAVAEKQKLSLPESKESQPEAHPEEATAKPTIEELQKYLDLPATKGIAKRRIKENPQWGYAIEENNVVEIACNQIIKSAQSSFSSLISIIKYHEEERFLAITAVGEKLDLFDYDSESQEWEKGGFLHPIERDTSNWQAYYDCLQNPKIQWLNPRWEFKNNIFVCTEESSDA